jgi:hypothetical protein
VIRLYVEIGYGGTVGITDNLGPVTVYITDELISDSDIGWEIDNEVKEIILEMIMEKGSDLFKNIKTNDIIELYIEYPKK